MLWGIYPTMDAIIAVFHLPEGTHANIHKSFRRKIYGEDTSSWGGRYHYHRKGILDEIPHVQLYWGVIIIKKSNYKKIEEIFSQYSTIIETRVVKCNKDDILRLTEHSP